MSFILVGTGLAVAGAALGAHSANKAKKEAEKENANRINRDSPSSVAGNRGGAA